MLSTAPGGTDHARVLELAPGQGLEQHGSIVPIDHVVPRQASEQALANLLELVSELGIGKLGNAPN